MSVAPTPPASYDSPWKELFDHELPLVLKYFFPRAYARVDWSEDWDSLEQEFRSIAPEAETGTRLADKLVRYKDVDSGDVNYLHAEVQGTPEAGFPRRVYVYGYRADDRYGLPAEQLVILTDDDPDWRPDHYLVRKEYSSFRLDFAPVKLLDWLGRADQMLKDENPVALFALAHLWSRQTRKDDAERCERKLTLIRELASRKLDGEDMQRWYRWFDWLLPLSQESRDEYYRQLQRIHREEKMPFVSDLEVWLTEQITEKVQKEVAAKHEAAMKQQSEQAEQAQREAEQAQREAEQAQREAEQAQREAEQARQSLLEAVLFAAHLKFGSDELRAALTGQPLAVVEAVSKALPGANSLDDVRSLIPS